MRAVPFTMIAQGWFGWGAVRGVLRLVLVGGPMGAAPFIVDIFFVLWAVLVLCAPLVVQGAIFSWSVSPFTAMVWYMRRGYPRAAYMLPLRGMRVALDLYGRD